MRLHKKRSNQICFQQMRPRFCKGAWRFEKNSFLIRTSKNPERNVTADPAGVITYTCFDLMRQIPFDRRLPRVGI